MSVRSLPEDFPDHITEKKDFLNALIQEGLDVRLIRIAIHNRTFPAYECHEVFLMTPRIEEIKESDPEAYKAITNARKALTWLLDNPIINEQEREALSSIEKRINDDYEIGLTDRKALLDSFRSRDVPTKIEDYADYVDYADVTGFEIDPVLRTEQQCEGRLITMLYEYIERFVKIINGKMLVGLQRDYNQKDIFAISP